MFDFEKLAVYWKAKAFNKVIYHYIKNTSELDRSTKDQLRRASFSVMLNIAEGSAKFGKRDRRNFFVIARGSAFECVAILDFLYDENLISKELQIQLYKNAEEISKILYVMIRNLESKD